MADSSAPGVMGVLAEFGESEAVWRGNDLEEDGWWNEGFRLDSDWGEGAASNAVVVEYQPCTLTSGRSPLEAQVRASEKLKRWAWMLGGRYDVVVDLVGRRLIVCQLGQIRQSAGTG